MDDTIPAVHTYPEMNKTVKDLLRLPPHDNPMNLYILARIEELEKEAEDNAKAKRFMEYFDALWSRSESCQLAPEWSIRAS